MSQVIFLTPTSGPGSGTVTSIAAGEGITLTPNPIVGTGTVALTVPVSIADGGTNATSMATTDGVVYYDGTRLVTTAVGTATQVLTSNGPGVAPTFQAAGGGGGGVTGPGSSTDRAIATWNGTGGSALFNNSTAIINSSGVYTNSALPAALIYSNSNAIIDNSASVSFGNDFSVTAEFNVGSIWTGTSFQAPVAGKYMVCGGGVVTSNTNTSQLVMFCRTNVGGAAGSKACFMSRAATSADISITFSSVLSLSAAEMFFVGFEMTGSGTCSLRGGFFNSVDGTNYPYTWVSCYLIA